MTTNSLKEILPLHVRDIPLHPNSQTSASGSSPCSLGEIAPPSKKRRCLNINQGELRFPTESFTTNHGSRGGSHAEFPVQITSNPDAFGDEERFYRAS